MTTSPPDLSQLRIPRDEPSANRRRTALRPLFWIAGVIVIATVVLWFLLAPRPLQVRVATASASGGAMAAGSGITANGYVVARTKASVSAKIAGRMAYLGVHEGSEVKKNQIIAKIESRDYEAALNAARAEVGEFEAQLAQAKRDLERAKTLRQQQLISDTDLEGAGTRAEVLAAQLNAARARERLAAANLENTRVRAPFDGTVLRKDAEVGEIVAPSAAGGGLTRTAIVTMADLATLEVEVDVNEAYIAQIRNGQAARITLDAYPDTSFAGKVRQVVPTADRSKATVQVKVSILDRDPRILPEMGAKVVFVSSEDGKASAVIPLRVSVPNAAVVRDASGARVWVVLDQRVTAKRVVLGLERGEQVEVRSGLAGGERLVLQPPTGLKEGTKVHIIGS